MNHQMTAHVFERHIFTILSNYALRKTAANHVRKYGEDVTSTLKQNFCR